MWTTAPTNAPSGSSPRVRGRHHATAGDIIDAGLIPAGAGQTPHTALWQTPWGAHPRRCGADWQARKTGGVVEGSSPRVRGRPCRRSCRVVSTVRAHPRGCGADAEADGVTVGDWGSSPRVRGRPLQHLHHIGLERLIPAGAGQTRQRFRVAHAGLGSSPRVRGRPQMSIETIRYMGLIPAGAGQTTNDRRPVGYHRAHPRGCGADFTRAQISDQAPGLIPAGAGQTLLVPFSMPIENGSSPRVRGRHRLPERLRRSHGLIPAGAGQTSPRGSPRPGGWAHPRGCGADRSSMRTTSSAHGSSPRVRGRRISNVSTNWLRRLIPAGAGQTHLRSQSSSALRAHPRGCGADERRARGPPFEHGSSPRVRGRLRALLPL